MAQNIGAAQIRSLADEFLLEELFSLETPLTHDSLSFVPIVKSDTSPHSDYINAAEALERGVLSITEIGNIVEAILAKNTGQVPILIEAAEVLVADGSQDRIVVENVILQPGEEKRIAVKCVHAPHGLRGGAGFSSMGVAGGGLHKSMRRMKYQSIMTDVEHYTPAYAVDQSEVWSEVKEDGTDAGNTDPTKYQETLTKRRKEVSATTKKIRESLPKGVCGLVIMDRKGGVKSFELYRSPAAFQKRIGFIESIIMEHKSTGIGAIEREAAWATAIQLIHRMKQIKDEEVVVKSDSDNLHIGFDKLIGEAIVGSDSNNPDRPILYCTLSTPS
ncbi:MAG: ARPP-1 family domain-containing protein [Candidatus Thorarchaeota archaeon]